MEKLHVITVKNWTKLTLSQRMSCVDRPKVLPTTILGNNECDADPDSPTTKISPMEFIKIILVCFNWKQCKYSEQKSSFLCHKILLAFSCTTAGCKFIFVPRQA